MKEKTKENNVEYLKKTVKPVVAALLILGVFACGGYGFYDLNAKVENQQAQIAANRKIYVYSLEDVLRATDAVAAKTKFESEVIKLNEEILEAEEKIKSLKDAKVKADFSDVYMKNLRLKRDDLVAKYEQSIMELTDKINKTVIEVADEKNAPAVFLKSAVAVVSGDVEDITSEVIARIKKINQT